MEESRIISIHKLSISTIIHILYCGWMFCVFAFSDTVTLYANTIALMLIIVCGIWIIMRKKVKLPKNIVPLVIFVIYAFLSCAWSISKDTSITRATSTFVLFALYICISLYSINSGDNKFLIDGMMIVANALCFYVLAVYGTGFIRQAIRYGSLERVGQEFVNANALGMILAYGSVIALFKAIFGGRIKQVIFAIVPVTFSLLTGSRKAIMIIAIGIAVIALLRLREGKNEKNGKKGIRRFLIFIVIIGGMIGLYYSAIGDLVRIRIGGLFAKGTARDFSTIERENMIQLGMAQFINSPLLGCGIGASDKLTGGTYLHNNYVELLATTGIIGFAFYYLFYIKNLFSYIKIAKTGLNSIGQAVGFFMCLALFAVDIGSVAYFSKTTYMVLVIITTYLSTNEENKNNYGRLRA